MSQPKGRRRVCCTRRLTTTLTKGSVTLTEVKRAVRKLMPSTNGFFATCCAQLELKSLSPYRCNILIYPHFPVHKRGLHKWNTRLYTSLDSAVFRNGTSVYICTCRVAEYHASENDTPARFINSYKWFIHIK